MDKMVQKVQTWLMEHYNGKDRFETIKEEKVIMLWVFFLVRCLATLMKRKRKLLLKLSKTR